MTTAEIANSLVALCRAGKFTEPYDALFAADARSVEGTGEVAAGMDAIRAKAASFDGRFTVNDITVSNPYLATDSFAVHFKADMTDRQEGKQIKMEEIGVYTVRDGKIVEEKFLFGM